jgi:hypothetical protein
VRKTRRRKSGIVLLARRHLCPSGRGRTTREAGSTSRRSKGKQSTGKIPHTLSLATNRFLFCARLRRELQEEDEDLGIGSSSRPASPQTPSEAPAKGVSPDDAAQLDEEDVAEDLAAQAQQIDLSAASSAEEEEEPSGPRLGKKARPRLQTTKSGDAGERDQKLPRVKARARKGRQPDLNVAETPTSTTTDEQDSGAATETAKPELSKRDKRRAKEAAKKAMGVDSQTKAEVSYLLQKIFFCD